MNSLAELLAWQHFHSVLKSRNILEVEEWHVKSDKYRWLDYRSVYSRTISLRIVYTRIFVAWYFVPFAPGDFGAPKYYSILCKHLIWWGFVMHASEQGPFPGVGDQKHLHWPSNAQKSTWASRFLPHWSPCKIYTSILNSSTFLTHQRSCLIFVQPSSTFCDVIEILPKDAGWAIVSVLDFDLQLTLV